MIFADDRQKSNSTRRELQTDVLHYIVVGNIKKKTQYPKSIINNRSIIDFEHVICAHPAQKSNSTRRELQNDILHDIVVGKIEISILDYQ